MATPLLLFLAAAMLTCATLTLSLNTCPHCGPTPVPLPLSTGPTCGNSSWYKIRCHNNATLLFDSVNNTYPITYISPSKNRLVIGLPPLNHTCVAADFRTYGLQLNDSGPFNITSSNTVLFLNCKDSILRSPLVCGNKSPLCKAYINATKSCGGGVCCSLRTGGSTTAHVLRLRPDGCQAYRSFVNLDPTTPVASWPSPGVELEWYAPPEPTYGGTT